MAFALVTHIAKLGNTDSSAVDTTASGGSKLFVAFVHYYPPGGLGATPISDSASNTWTAGTAYANPNTGNFRGVKLYYVISPSTSATHTFRTNTASYGSITVLAFSAASTPSVGGAQVGAGQDSGATLQPGSVTPATASDVFVFGGTQNSTSLGSIDSSFTIGDSDSGGAAVCSYISAYKIKVASSTAENPTWTVGNTLDACTQMSFQEGGGGSSVTPSTRTPWSPPWTR